MDHYKSRADAIKGLTTIQEMLSINPIEIDTLLKEGIDFNLVELISGVYLSNYGDLIIPSMGVSTFTTSLLPNKAHYIFLNSDYRFIAVYDLVSDTHECTIQNSGGPRVLELVPFKFYSDLEVELRNLVLMSPVEHSSSVVGTSITWNFNTKYAGDVEYQESGYYLINYLNGNAIRVSGGLDTSIDVSWNEFIVIPFIKNNKEYYGQYKIIIE